MVEIIKNLYVGGDTSVPKAKERGMVICACCKDGPDSHRTALGYRTLGAPKGKNYYFVERGNHLWLNLIDVDDPGFVPEPVINKAVEFIGQHWKNNEKVLVHCNMGHSRGPTTALMFLRSVGEMPHGFVHSEKVFRTLYPLYDPAQGMRQYARSHWADLAPKG